jgi:hypothetical protein
MRLTRPLAGLLLALTTAAQAYVGPPGATGIAQDLPEALQTRVAALANSLRKERGEKAMAGRSANSLAIECLTAAELYARGDKAVESSLRQSATALAEQAIDGGKKPAWGREDAEERSLKCPAGGFDHFGDGTCDPAGTAYAFQSGLATACVVRAGKLLGDARLKDFGQRALDFWKPKSSLPRECNGCRYFWASDVQADSHRFVRNTSQFIALPFAIAEGGSGRTPSIVDESLKAEAWERSKGNRGYLSALDPQWKAKATEADRIENHAAAVGVLLRGVAFETGSAQAADLALWNYETWARCGNERCVKTGCKYWAGNPQQCAVTATYAHCAFRNVSGEAREKCLALLQRNEGLNLNALLWVMVGDTPAAPAGAAKR